jgi:hypothetical protein
VTLRGTKYDISDVTTVEELQERVKEASGVATDQSVLFGEKRLQASDVLSDVGVSDGAQLNMVPTTTKKKKKTTTKTSSSSISSTGASAPVTGAPVNPMQDYLKQAGLDTDKLDELVKGMGGDGAPSMEESMEAMSDMMNSPIFKEFMEDPEKLEQSRQMILNNPMLKQMMAGMPGMEDLLNDPDGWREAMHAAANLYKDMDSNDLMKSMMGGPGGGMMGAPGGGLFDGTLDQSAAAAALDELEEED